MSEKSRKRDIILNKLKVYTVISIGGLLGVTIRLIIDKNANFIVYNLLGAFIIGFFITIVKKLKINSYLLNSFFVIGFLGSLTSFGALIRQLTLHLEHQEYRNFAISMILIILFGIFFVYIGAKLAAFIARKVKRGKNA